MPVNAEDSEILISVDVSQALHFDHELKMSAILGKDCGGRLNGRSVKSQQMGLVGCRVEMMRTSILNVMEFVARKVERAVQENRSQPDLIVGGFPSSQPVVADNRVAKVKDRELGRVVVGLNGIRRVANETFVSIQNFHD